jgi:hypothetical protein
VHGEHNALQLGLAFGFGFADGMMQQLYGALAYHLY